MTLGTAMLPPANMDFSPDDKD